MPDERIPFIATEDPPEIPLPAARGTPAPRTEKTARSNRFSFPRRWLGTVASVSQGRLQGSINDLTKEFLHAFEPCRRHRSWPATLRDLQPASAKNMTTHVARDGQVFGTFEDEDLKSAIAAGTVQLSDLGWREGMADWCSIAELLSADTTSPPQDDALDNPAATIPPDSETPPAQPATEEELASIQQLDGQPPTRISDDEAAVVGGVKVFL